MPTRPLTIVTWNIHGAIGRDRRREPARIAQVLAEIGADLVALQEVPLGGSRGSDVLEPIARTLGMDAIAGPGIDGPELRFGNALLSRHPIESSRRLDLAFGCAEPRCAVDATVRVDGRPVRMIATHLGLRPAERREQVRRLLRAILTGVAEDADERARRSPAERAAREARAAARAGVGAPRVAGRGARAGRPRRCWRPRRRRRSRSPRRGVWPPRAIRTPTAGRCWCWPAT
jgi:endonuclease/exonuclease/phosphatase family metal-dependent hydrolase